MQKCRIGKLKEGKNLLWYLNSVVITNKSDHNMTFSDKVDYEIASGK